MAASRTFKRYRVWIGLALLAAVAAAAYIIYSGSETSEPTTTYETEPATPGTISVTVAGTGNLAIDGTTDVYPTVSGTVASVEVSEGSHVVTDTVLFTLDAGDAEASSAKAYSSYTQAQQSVVRAESDLLRAENTLTDLEEGYAEQQEADEEPVDSSETTATLAADTGSNAQAQAQTDEVTQADIDEADKDVDAAEAGLTSAQASRSSAYLSYEQALDAESDLSVRSPSEGIVYELNVEVGDSASSSGGGSSTATGDAQTATSGSSGSSEAPAVIAPDEPTALRLTVNEVDVPEIEVGQRADVEFDAIPELTATGKVYSVDDEGVDTQGVVTYDVWIALDVVDERLRIGMSAAATVVTDVARDVLLVPNSAVEADGEDGYYVQVLEHQATEPRRAPVEIGLASATHTEILSGIEAGDEVVTQTVESTDETEEEEGGGGFALPGMGGGPPR